MSHIKSSACLLHCLVATVINCNYNNKSIGSSVLKDKSTNVKIIVYFHILWQAGYNKTNVTSSKVICVINFSEQTEILFLNASNLWDLTTSEYTTVYRANKMQYKMTLFQFLFAIILVFTSGQKITSFGTDSGIFVS